MKPNLNLEMLQELYFAVEYNYEKSIGNSHRNEKLLEELDRCLEESRVDLPDELISELFMVLLENDIHRFDDGISESCSKRMFSPAFSSGFDAVWA